MKISVIGVGAMGGALAQGILKSNILEKNGDLCVYDISSEVLQTFKANGTRIATTAQEAAQVSDIVMVVVKPWFVQELLTSIREVLDYKKQQLIVVAAGISSTQVEEWLCKDGTLPPFYLTIPNIAIEVLASMTFLVPFHSSKQQTETVTQLFNKMGQTMIVEEHLLGAATTLASCGIAYAMRYVRASTEGGVEMGFKAQKAQEIVQQTVLGAVQLLQAKKAHPEELIDKVTTPGGVTIKGLNEMEHAGFTSAVIRGLKAGMK